MDQRSTLAFGLTLKFFRAEEGGRTTPTTGGNAVENRFAFRPNWGLPAMTPPEQTGAMVFGFSKAHILPGESVRAVIVVPYPEMVGHWDQQVDAGTLLPMYEGPRVFGEGIVEWRGPATLPLDEQRAAEFDAWLTLSH